MGDGSMTSDYTFKNGYREEVVKTICDGKKHRNYIKVMNVWVKGDEYECLCAQNIPPIKQWVF